MKGNLFIAFFIIYWYLHLLILRPHVPKFQRLDSILENEREETEEVYCTSTKVTEGHKAWEIIMKKMDLNERLLLSSTCKKLSKLAEETAEFDIRKINKKLSTMELKQK